MEPAADASIVVDLVRAYVLMWAMALVAQCVSDLISGRSLHELRARLPWIVKFTTIITLVAMVAFAVQLWLDPQRLVVDR